MEQGKQIIMDMSLGILWFLTLTIWLLIEKNNPEWRDLYGDLFKG